MIFELVAAFTGGVVVGLAIKQEILVHRYEKTYSQIDEKVRKELAYYKNLSESLKQDLRWAKIESKTHSSTTANVDSDQQPK